MICSPNYCFSFASGWDRPSPAREELHGLLKGNKTLLVEKKESKHRVREEVMELREEEKGLEGEIMKILKKGKDIG